MYSARVDHDDKQRAGYEEKQLLCEESREPFGARASAFVFRGSHAQRFTSLYPRPRTVTSEAGRGRVRFDLLAQSARMWAMSELS